MKPKQNTICPLIWCALSAVAVFQGCDTMPGPNVPNNGPNQNVPNPDAKPAPVLNSDGDMPAGWLTPGDYVVTLQPAAGSLYLWESWLRHEVTPNQAKGERISISFNYGWR